MIGLNQIAPGKSVQIDVAKLRDEQVRDERGNMIPVNAVGGQIGWFLRQKYETGDEKVRRLALSGRSEQIDLVKKTSSSYACINCCNSSATQGFVSPDPFASFPPASNDFEFEFGDSVQYYAYIGERDCNQNLHYCRVSAEEWRSSQTSVATVSSSGLVQIVGVGDVEIEAEIDGYITLEGPPCDPGPYLTETCDVAKKTGIAEFDKTPTGKDTIINQIAECSGCDDIDYDPEPDADISAKPKVTNVTAVGATKISQVVGNNAIIHFVTPKGSGSDQVTLTATVSPNTK